MTDQPTAIDVGDIYDLSCMIDLSTAVALGDRSIYNDPSYIID